jgi:anti-sigma regulatory factor (Ser/Thr protein kinase)
MPSPPWPGQPEAAPPSDLLAGDFTAGEFRLLAKPSELQRVRDYADQAAVRFGFGHAERFEFVFAVNEAVTNAIRHGTADEAGTIGLRIAADGDRLLVDVCDRGPFVKPVASDEPMPDRGRGFQLMARLMDDVEVRVRPAGTTVRLGKRLRVASRGPNGNRG